MPGRMEFEFGFATQGIAGRKRQEGPMRLLLMGDFSGRADRGVVEIGSGLASRPVRSLDVDNFESVMGRCMPRLHLSLGETQAAKLDLEFRALDDFHPDALYRGLELFQALRTLRDRLAKPDTFPQASKELMQSAMASGVPPTASPATEPLSPEQPESDEDMFQRLLGKTPGKPGPENLVQATGVDKFIHDIVRPYIVHRDIAHQDAYIASVDEAISTQMRRLLHEPAFQALESSWRSVHRLVTGLETGEELRLYLLDVSKQELTADIAAAGENLQGSGLYRLLVEQGMQTLGGEPWSLLVGDYRFGPGAEDTGLLAALGAIASQAGGPFLAEASPEVLGCASLADNPSPEAWQPLEHEAERCWRALRQSPVARWIGLALPRVLLRLPYGSEAEAIDTFGFEEVSVAPGDHEDYLWGSPACACAMLLAAAFLDRGWAMQPGDYLDIEDLPAYTYVDDEGRSLMPCAEVLLSERTGEVMLGRGVMPLLSYRNRNAVRVLRFQSIADPLTALSGAWA